MQRHRYVDTKIMCLIDGDATYEPRDFVKLVGMVRRGYDMALGNRFDRLDRGSMPLFHRVRQQGHNGCRQPALPDVASDSQTGIRAIRTSAFQSLDLRERGLA